MVTNETDAATEDKQAIECTDLDVFVGLFGGESAAVPQKVNETNSDASVNIQDKLDRMISWCDSKSLNK